MPNAPHRNRRAHGFEAPSFTVRPCPSCGSRAPQSSVSTDTPDMTRFTCFTCKYQWLQESDQRIAATLSTIGSAA